MLSFPFLLSQITEHWKQPDCPITRKWFSKLVNPSLPGARWGHSQGSECYEKHLCLDVDWKMHNYAYS